MSETVWIGRGTKWVHAALATALRRVPALLFVVQVTDVAIIPGVRQMKRYRTRSRTTASNWVGFPVDSGMSMHERANSGIAEGRCQSKENDRQI